MLKAKTPEFSAALLNKNAWEMYSWAGTLMQKH